MHSYSNRVRAIEPSATVRISDLAEKYKSQGTDIVDLSAGDPDFDTPDHIVQAAKTALDSGRTHYTSSAGIAKLRELIADKLRTENGLEVTSEDIVVTPGAKQGLFEAMFALLNEGDEVLLCDPSWVSYEALVKMCGAKTRRIELPPERGFAFEQEPILDAIGEDTKAIIVNTPSNPTGKVVSDSELKMIRDIAIDEDIWIISDEIYEKIIYEEDHVSIGSYDGMQNRTITVNGFSKSHAMTGWRVGYYTAPSELMDLASKIQSHTVTCATSFAQHGAIAALSGSQAPVKQMRERFEQRRDSTIDRLQEMGIQIDPPKGAFYCFLPVRGNDDVSISEDILEEANVAVTPGSAFGMSGFIRISTANSQERILEGIERMEDYL